MRPRKSESKSPADLSPEPPGLPLLDNGHLAPLLGDFPEPVMVTDRKREVVFFNRAAEELFGDTLHVGDPCPVCPQGSVWAEDQAGLQRCPRLGQPLIHQPFLLRDSQGRDLQSMVTATPIRRPDGQPGGCFIIFRELQEGASAHRAAHLQLAALNSILENFPMPFFMVDPNLVVTYTNAHMERLTKYSREEIVGRMSCGSVLNTIQCGTEECVLAKVMQTKTPVSGLRRTIRDRLGREIEVVVSASIITDAAGRVIGGFEALRDISPLVQAEQQINLLSELSKEGILIVDEDLRVRFANSKLAKIVNLTKEELLGRDLGEVLTQQHRRRAEELIRQEQNLTIEGDWNFICTLDPLPGSPPERRVFETWMTVSQVGDQKFTYIYLWDLTNRIRMGRDLQKANTFLTRIIQCSVDGIVVVDNKGYPLIFNEGAENILGYKAEEIIGHPEMLLKFYPREVAREMKKRMLSNEYGPPDKLNTTQVTFFHKNGEEIPVNFSATIIREGSEEVASVGIFSDLRETVKMRKELEESQVQLLQAEKIASLGRLSAGVAHEINNPLAGILIYAELLQMEMGDQPSGKEYIEEIITQTLRCQKIVTRLLEFSRQSLGEKTGFDVNDVISRCIDLVKHHVTFHNITIILDLDPELPLILGDPGQIQQVFTNLLINAADAMEGKGRIRVTTQEAPGGEGIRITFGDSGPGIPAEIRGKIFEPFFTTKPPGKGTGLGLSIVYGVVRRHGGSIEVDTPPAGGTVFTIQLPLESPLEETQLVFP